MGLALSGAAHVALLALVLWLQARNAILEPVWNTAPVHLVPPVTEAHFVPPALPRDFETTTPGATDRKGTVDPVDGIDRPDIPMSEPISRPPDDPRSGPPSTRTGTAAFAVEPTDDPPESAAIPFEAAPIPTFRPEPLYPDWCREQRIEGRVVLHALIGRDGRVRRVSVVRGVKGLSEPAQAAIARWLFKPATFGGKPVAVWVEIPVEFRL